MRRRRFLVLGTVLLAGCSGDGGDDDSQSAPSGPSEENDGYAPSITYDSCTSVTVDSSEPYHTVALALDDGTSPMYEEGYEGSTTFEEDVVIDDTVVWANAGKASKENPDAESCSTPS